MLRKKTSSWNQTLNARGESIFEKPAFRNSARNKRCIVHVEGFYEHHHFGKRTYPDFIRLKDHDDFALAALWEECKDPATGVALHTFSIVTTEANDLLRRIHNNPKLEGPRMPVNPDRSRGGRLVGPDQQRCRGKRPSN